MCALRPDDTRSEFLDMAERKAPKRGGGRTGKTKRGVFLLGERQTSGKNKVLRGRECVCVCVWAIAFVYGVMCDLCMR